MSLGRHVARFAGRVQARPVRRPVVPPLTHDAACRKVTRVTMEKTRITRTDVARRAGVSKTAVTYALTGAPGTHLSAATVKRVLSAARALGYQPNFAARSLAAAGPASSGSFCRLRRCNSPLLCAHDRRHALRRGDDAVQFPVSRPESSGEISSMPRSGIPRWSRCSAITNRDVPRRGGRTQETAPR